MLIRNFFATAAILTLMVGCERFPTNSTQTASNNADVSVTTTAPTQEAATNSVVGEVNSNETTKPTSATTPESTESTPEVVTPTVKETEVPTTSDKVSPMPNPDC